MKTRRELLTTTAYFPPANWVRAAADSAAWTLEGHENYQKKGWRNRCRIIGPNGPVLLSVPLEKGAHRQQPIQEVRIAYDQAWHRDHVRSIRTAYGRAPYFEYYAEELFAVLKNRPETLWELNRQLLDVLLRQLQLPVTLAVTEDYRPQTPTDLPNLLPYPQVFTERHGFASELSILDALFCLGPTFGQAPVAAD